MAEIVNIGPNPRQMIVGHPALQSPFPSNTHQTRASLCFQVFAVP